MFLEVQLGHLQTVLHTLEHVASLLERLLCSPLRNLELGEALALVALELDHRPTRRHARLQLLLHGFAVCHCTPQLVLRSAQVLGHPLPHLRRWVLLQVVLERSRVVFKFSGLRLVRNTATGLTNPLRHRPQRRQLARALVACPVAGLPPRTRAPLDAACGSSLGPDAGTSVLRLFGLADGREQPLGQPFGLPATTLHTPGAVPVVEAVAVDLEGRQLRPDDVVDLLVRELRSLLLECAAPVVLVHHVVQLFLRAPVELQRLVLVGEVVLRQPPRDHPWGKRAVRVVVLVELLRFKPSFSVELDDLLEDTLCVGPPQGELLFHVPRLKILQDHRKTARPGAAPRHLRWDRGQCGSVRGSQRRRAVRSRLVERLCRDASGLMHLEGLVDQAFEPALHFVHRLLQPGRGPRPAHFRALHPSFRLRS